MEPGAGPTGQNDAFSAARLGGHESSWSIEYNGKEKMCRASQSSTFRKLCYHALTVAG